MAKYEEMFQGKEQKFLIRNAVGSDAPTVIQYMTTVNRESTFLWLRNQGN